MIEAVEMDGATYAQPPERFEAGTQPVAEAVGMGAAAEYLAAAGMDRVAAHEKKLTERMLAGMAHGAPLRAAHTPAFRRFRLVQGLPGAVQRRGRRRRLPGGFEESPPILRRGGEMNDSCVEER